MIRLAANQIKKSQRDLEVSRQYFTIGQPHNSSNEKTAHLDSATVAVLLPLMTKGPGRVISGIHKGSRILLYSLRGAGAE